MRFSFCGVTSKRPRWSAFARNALERTTVRRSPMPQDGLLRPPPLQLDVDTDIRGHERSGLHACLLQNLAALLLAGEGELRLKQAEIDLDLRVHSDRAHESRAALEDGPNRRDSSGSDPFQEAEANDPTLGPFSGSDLRIRIPRIEAVEVHVARGVFRIVRPSLLRVPGDAHPDVAFLLAIGTEEGLENSSLHGEGRLELEARLDRTGHRDANGRHDDKPHHA